MSRRLALAWVLVILIAAIEALSPVAVSARRGSHAYRVRPQGLASEAKVHYHRETGMVRFIGGSRRAPAVRAAAIGDPVSSRSAARAFIADFGPAFGARRPARDLRLRSTESPANGQAFFRYQQVHRGIPVLGGELVVHVGKANRIEAAFGELAPDLSLSTTPRLTAEAAERLGAAATARAVGVPASALATRTGGLRIVDRRLVGGPGPRLPRLAWQVDVSAPERGVWDQVFVDADSGGIVLRFDRSKGIGPLVRICDAGGKQAEVPCTAADKVDSPSPASDAGRAETFARDFWDYFWTRFERDSWDAQGHRIVSTVRYCFTALCPYRGAFWYLDQAVFGKDFAQADDVVGHELAHGLTQHWPGFFPWYQSGAIDESISDIFGELIDQANSYDRVTGPASLWKQGEDLPGGAIRNMKDPTSTGQPDRMSSALYTADTKELDAGGIHTNSGVGNKAAYLMAVGTEGGSFNGHTIAGIGNDKTAAVWYLALYYLHSGSDYADLADALVQTCYSERGPRWQLTDADCQQVAEAVNATEMRQDPTTPMTTPRRAAKCPPGSAPFHWEDSNLRGWHGSSVEEGNPIVWRNPAPAPWRYSPDFHANAWGEDYGRHPAGSPRNITDFVLTSGDILGGGLLRSHSYMSIDHAYDFEDGRYKGTYYRFDGGVLEYDLTPSRNAGWRDLKQYILANGYTGKIARPFGNPLRGRRAFTAESFGYERSVFDLSTFDDARYLNLRFRLGTDNSVGDLGWFINNVEVYTCGTEGDVEAPVVTPPTLELATGNMGPMGYRVPVMMRFTAEDQASEIAISWGGPDPGTGHELAHADSTEGRSFTTEGVTTLWIESIDTAGNASPMVYGEPMEVRSAQTEGDGMSFTGAWTDRTDSAYYLGSARSATTASATASRTFIGTDVGLVSTIGPDRGRVRVTVDGTEVPGSPFDLYHDTMVHRRVVFAMHLGDTNAEHTVTIAPTGTHSSSSTGDRVDFDGFLTMSKAPT